MKKEKMRGSETKVIKRSQIKLNPYNPKHHTDEQVKLQKKNLKQVGFLGGIVWNERSGNLVDGHRRIKALDLINKYDGSNDYEIKVEAVDFSEKEELNQLTYMAVGNTKADYNLIAKYAPEIDYASVGLTEEQYNEILTLRQKETVEAIPSWEDDFITELDVPEISNEEFQQELADKPKMTKDEVKQEKAKCTDIANNRHEEDDLYVILNFKDYEQKLAFCELLGVEAGSYMNIKGQPVEDLLSRLG